MERVLDREMGSLSTRIVETTVSRPGTYLQAASYKNAIDLAERSDL